MRLQGGEARDWIVCGWFTEDETYKPFAERLAASLEAVGAPYDIVSVPRLPGGWEAATMTKPRHILAAMDRHPDRTIIFLDVDCTAKSSLDPLTQISGDVGFYMRAQFHRRYGWRFKAVSGTLIIRPTERARAFVEAWAQAADEAPCGEVDQTAQVVAMGRAPGTSFTAIPSEWCGAVGKPSASGAIILHDNASKDAFKVTYWQRRVLGLLGDALAKRVLSRLNPA